MTVAVDPKEIDRIYDAADKAVKLAIAPLAVEIFEKDLPDDLFYCMGFGALSGVCSFMRATIPPENRPHMEIYILGVVRGILRDMGAAIDADGQVLDLKNFLHQSAAP